MIQFIAILGIAVMILQIGLSIGHRRGYQQACEIFEAYAAGREDALNTEETDEA